MADPQLASVNAQGVQLACAAYRSCDPADMPPVATLAAGQSLIDFWHLKPVKVPGWERLWMSLPAAPNLDRPEINQLLQDMLSIRRMSSTEVHALAERIHGLPKILDHDTGLYAPPVLLSRMEEALSNPATFSGLLTERELRQVYAEDSRYAALLGAPSKVDSAVGNVGSLGAIVAPNAAKVGWVARAAQVLGRAAVVGPAARGVVAAPGAWSGFKKGGAGLAMWWWTKFITGQGAEQQKKGAEHARDELLRRGLRAP